MSLGNEVMQDRKDLTCEVLEAKQFLAAAIGNTLPCSLLTGGGQGSDTSCSAARAAISPPEAE